MFGLAVSREAECRGMRQSLQRFWEGITSLGKGTGPGASPGGKIMSLARFSETFSMAVKHELRLLALEQKQT